MRRHARAALRGAGVGLLLAGLVSVVEAELSPAALHASAPMPDPPDVVPASTDPDATPTPAAAPDGTGADSSGPTAAVGRSVPVRIDIAAIGVHAAVIPMGLEPDGTLGVPGPGPHYNDTAWYDRYPTPGEPGPALITGHLDSAHDGPSVFYRLGALVPGDHVAVTRADGRTVTFTVTGLGRYPQRAFPTEKVYGDLDYAGLRLITCGATSTRAPTTTWTTSSSTPC